MAYFEELLELPEALLKNHMALSRSAAEEKRYVQDALLEQADLITDFLRDKNSYIFICGQISMEHGVMDVFKQIAERELLSWDDLHHELLHEGRLQIETY